MRTPFFILLVLSIFVSSKLLSQSPDKNTASGSANLQTDSPKAPVATPEPHPDQLISRFDVANIDKSADPCVDFYQYACGNWIKNNPIPADHPYWGSFPQISAYNESVLVEILEKASKDDPKRSPVMQKIGDFYASCMDVETISRNGYNALKPDLALISSIKDKVQLFDIMGRLEGHGGGSPFNFSSGPDPHQSTRSIAFVDQGGISLPDKSFYINDNSAAIAMRKQFVERVKAAFLLIDQTPEQAEKNAQAVLAVETEMAKAFADRVARRDPKNRDHKMSVADLKALAPNFQWDRYFTAVGAPPFKDLNVSNPDYFKILNPVIESVPLDSWKAYMTWHLVSTAAEWLTDAFAEENFKFRQMLTGQKEMRARWKRCVDGTDSALGDALGQAYVDETFGADGKQRMLKMVQALENALRQDISDSSWMTAPTKKQALIKLAAIRNKIGFPDTWHDLSKLEIVRGDLAGNFLRSMQYEVDRVIQKIDKPVDKDEWIFSTPTVNAYYNSNFNEIVFPAGVLQPPFFDRDMDDSVNFGAIGMIIGHELTHGFDDQGRQFDGNGDLHDWWSPTDAKEFDKRADCFVNEYGSYKVVDEVAVNSKLTLGENIADNGGVRISLMALHQLMAAANQDAVKKIDGYTTDQRFFLGFARAWCSNTSPQFARMRATMDPHSPARLRTNGVVQNMPEFQKAFGCKAGQPMVKENACHLW